MILLENQKGLFHHLKTHFRMPCEAMNDFWSMSGNFIHRHHVEARVKLYSPREESFPIPLKYIDISRTTHTNLDVMQERRIEDYWNIDGSRDLSDSWTGFTRVTLLEEKPPDGFLWSRERLTRKQLTSRPDYLWPELWTKLGRNAQLKERQKWSDEKPKLNNARRLRGICFIDPEKTTRNAAEQPPKASLEVPRHRVHRSEAEVSCLGVGAMDDIIRQWEQRTKRIQTDRASHGVHLACSSEGRNI